MFGFTSSTTVMLDLDKISELKAVRIGVDALEEFKLGGVVVAESSKRHYHVIFNRRLSKFKVFSIVSTLCIRLKLEALTKYFLEQSTRGDFTLRISPKGKKPSPRIVFQYGKQGGEIQNYLQDCELLKSINKKSRVESLIS